MPHNQSHQAITWVHLSDVHLCDLKTGWDVHRVLDSLTTDLEGMERDHGLKPDLLFFTGDAAYGELAGAEPGWRIASQFEEAHQLLETVRTAFSKPIENRNVFLVPGNHDVNRNESTDSLRDWLDDPKRKADEINDLIHKRSKDWRHYMERLQEYRSFVQKYYPHLAADPDRLIYNEVRELAGIRLGIAGLNSAWSCCREGEKSKLWMGANWQLGNAGKALRNRCDARLALMHHPANWLVEAESNRTELEIERDFEFHLHGHEHHGWVRNPDKDHVRVAAAAGYDRSDRPNGYSFVRWIPRTGEVEVWLRQFDRDGGGWVPRKVANRTDNNGMWPCQIRPVGGKSLPNHAELLPDLAPSLSQKKSELGKSTPELLVENKPAVRFRVALTFPGQKRDYVRKVAESLGDRLGREAVFFDEWYRPELARLGLDVYLQKIYQDEAELLVPFLCAEYAASEWCGLEWRVIRSIIHKRRDNDVMPLRFDSTDVPGFLSIDGSIDISRRSPEEVAEDILIRLGLTRTTGQQGSTNVPSGSMELETVPQPPMDFSKQDPALISAIQERVEAELMTSRPAELKALATTVGFADGGLTAGDLSKKLMGGSFEEILYSLYDEVCKGPETRQVSQDLAVRLLNVLVLLVVSTETVRRFQGYFEPGTDGIPRQAHCSLTMKHPAIYEWVTKGALTKGALKQIVEYIDKPRENEILRGRNSVTGLGEALETGPESLDKLASICANAAAPLRLTLNGAPDLDLDRVRVRTGRYYRDGRPAYAIIKREHYDRYKLQELAQKIPHMLVFIQEAEADNFILCVEDGGMVVDYILAILCADPDIVKGS